MHRSTGRILYIFPDWCMPCPLPWWWLRNGTPAYTSCPCTSGSCLSRKNGWWGSSRRLTGGSWPCCGRARHLPGWCSWQAWSVHGRSLAPCGRSSGTSVWSLAGSRRAVSPRSCAGSPQRPLWQPGRALRLLLLQWYYSRVTYYDSFLM